MRKLSIPAVLAGALLLGACGNGNGDGDAAGDDGAAAASGGTTVVATEFAFDPEDLTLAADTDVELTLDNQGVVEHDIVVEELDDRELVYAPPGESVTESVNLPAGDYTMYCSIPGHRASGMEGSLTVE